MKQRSCFKCACPRIKSNGDKNQFKDIKKISDESDAKMSNYSDDVNRDPLVTIILPALRGLIYLQDG
jgi:hypothetical protein